MAEYIRRMSAMTICERHRQHCFESNDNRGQDIADRIFDEITEIPTADVVEVVRCKDCKYCEHINDEFARDYYQCKRRGNSFYRKLDDFCSYGELKEREG